ncbi:MAG: hypothetical protein WCF84_17285 [Anaerolineae bacterium]
MNINRIHFLREVLVTYHFLAAPVPLMQFSYDNPSYVSPVFERAPDASQTRVRALYYRLGGIRRAEETVGSTVVIPERSLKDQLLQLFDV